MSWWTRRDFIKTGVGIGVSSLVSKLANGQARKDMENKRSFPLVVASSNGLKAAEKAMLMLKNGANTLDAVVAGVNIVEDDPEDMSVGYGGLPNEEGVVELDASVMYGPTHRAGAVAALRNIKNPSKVARLVMERTDHVLLVGKGALKFARAHGFKEENLLTDKAREMWLRWKENLSDKDNWLSPENEKIPDELKQVMNTYGTINCLAIDSGGKVAGVTTTSGLAWKLSGRVGDSPIIGAGLYVDNEIGAAGSTGRGEANLQTCASYRIVDLMGRGRSPEQACLETLEAIAQKTKLIPRLCDQSGRPKFGLNFYALNIKREYGSASFYQGNKYVAHDGKTNKLLDCAYLFKK